MADGQGQRVMSPGTESCGQETRDRMLVDQESVDRLQPTTCFVMNGPFIYVSSMAELGHCDGDHRARKARGTFWPFTEKVCQPLS